MISGTYFIDTTPEGLAELNDPHSANSARLRLQTADHVTGMLSDTAAQVLAWEIVLDSLAGRETDLFTSLARVTRLFPIDEQ